MHALSIQGKGAEADIVLVTREERVLGDAAEYVPLVPLGNNNPGIDPLVIGREQVRVGRGKSLELVEAHRDHGNRLRLDLALEVLSDGIATAFSQFVAGMPVVIVQGNRFLGMFGCIDVGKQARSTTVRTERLHSGNGSPHSGQGRSATCPPFERTADASKGFLRVYPVGAVRAMPATGRRARISRIFDPRPIGHNMQCTVHPPPTGGCGTLASTMRVSATSWYPR